MKTYFKGSDVLIDPISPSLITRYPAGSWVKQRTKVKLLENVPTDNKVDTIKVKYEGNEKNIYDFQMIRRV